MNRKGFTLIELLAVIVLIGIIGIITVPNVLKMVRTSRDSTYQILIDNIITASENYYTECEYGDLSDSEKYGANKCQISSNTITTTLGSLVDLGFLKTDSSKEVVDPRNKNNISDCEIKIKKITNSDIISYTIVKKGSDSKCPKAYKKAGE